jgi:hypothetical protein
MSCGCGGSGAGPAFTNYGTAAAAGLANVGVSLAAAGPYAPAVQVQAFEPAFYTPCPTWSVIPYSPALVSVAMPVYGAAAAANTAAIGTVLAEQATGIVPPGATLAPAFTANGCGPCRQAYSPLPPNGFYAWQKLLQDTNRPYDSLVSGGYGIRRTY